MNKANLFDGLDSIDLTEEFIEKIFTREGSYIERILSSGHKTTEGEWLDQDLNEWVILLQGEAILKFEETGETKLSKGDYVLVPAHCKHRVEWTSQEPKCIWLAFFFK